MLLAIPDHRIVVALLTNSALGGALLGEAEQWILSQLELPPATVAPPANYQLTRREVAPLVGTYSDIWTTSVVASRRNVDWPGD